MTDPEDPTSLSDRHPRPQGSVHLIIGPVGAGKSTRAIDLARTHCAVRLTLDDWMARLFRPDRPAEGVVPWYVERAARCVDQIWRTAREVVGTGTSVVLEIGLLSRREREAFYARVDEAGARLVLHVVDAPRDERRARVLRRNEEQGATFSVVVPPDVFELASDLWEPPDDAELDGRIKASRKTG
jgi:predicted kinase